MGVILESQGVSLAVALSDRDFTVDLFVQANGVVCGGEQGLRQVFRQGGKAAPASDICFQQTQECADGSVFMEGLGAADYAPGP